MRPWYQYAFFFTMVTAVVGGIHYYLYARLARAPELEGLQRIGRWVFLVGAVLIPAGMLTARFLPRPVGPVIAGAVFTWMGLVILLFFLTLASEPIRAVVALLEATRALPEDPERRHFLARALSGAIALGGIVVGGYGVASVLAPVVVKPVRIGLKKFPSRLGVYRIVQLTDVHIGPTIDGTWLRGVVERVNALQPDLVAITGDLVDGKVEALREHVAPLGDLRAKHGVFFVTGNHEYYSGVDQWLAELGRLGVRVLRNEHVRIGQGEASFDLAGVDDWRSHEYGNGHGADLARAVEGRDPERELILLAHQPKQALEAAKSGVGLQLSGHTHGGQIFPWGFFVKLDQGFVAGLDRVGDMLLYTSCGTGYWGPPMRVGAPAEITLLEVQREERA
ncbi:metallophosphoesterase [Pendulispora albinea]|uniref:Metallophosphoesterase n=1 Tax=Pendulispora albinea TaxID=2741071 RepID=A0ABZ2M0Q8_9BACT